MKKERESAVEPWLYHGYYMRRLRNHGYGGKSSNYLTLDQHQNIPKLL